VPRSGPLDRQVGSRPCFNPTVILDRILDIGAKADDEQDLRIRKRTAVASVLAFIAVALFYAVADVPLANPAASFVAVVQIAAFVFALAMFQRSRRLDLLVAAMIVIGLSVIFVGLNLAGGLSAGAGPLVWSLLVPLGAVLFLGARAAAPAFGAVALIVLAAVAIDPFVRGEPPPPSTARLVLSAVNLLAATAVALGLVLFIDGERVRARAESDALLLNILPRSIADRLKRGERVIADHYEAVTVLFADIVDFTPFAAAAPPARVVAVLNEIFSRFDALAEQHGLEKIKTIGDAYMLVAGAPTARPDHAPVVLEMALAMSAATESAEPLPGVPLRLRIGIASGPAVAGVIGQRKFSFDLWGDAVNLASRMESTGVPGMIQIAESTWQLCHDRYPFTPRDVDVKGKGPMRTYLLDPRSVVRGV
jgi:adenylate cyclase